MVDLNKLIVIGANSLEDLKEKVRKLEGIKRFHQLVLPVKHTSSIGSYEGIPYRKWIYEGAIRFDCCVEIEDES